VSVRPVLRCLMVWVMVVVQGGLTVLGIQLHHLGALSHRIFPPSSGTCCFWPEKGFAFPDPQTRLGGLRPGGGIFEPCRSWGGIASRLPARLVGCTGFLLPARTGGLGETRRERSVAPWFLDRAAPAAGSHDPALCPICQYLGQAKLAAPALPKLVGGLLVVSSPAVCPTRVPSFFIGPYRARAPPSI